MAHNITGERIANCRTSGGSQSAHVSRRQRLETEARQPPLTAVRLTSRRVRLVSASTHGMLCTGLRSTVACRFVHAAMRYIPQQAQHQDVQSRVTEVQHAVAVHVAVVTPSLLDRSSQVFGALPPVIINPRSP